jgi:hypothetical protein
MDESNPIPDSLPPEPAPEHAGAPGGMRKSSPSCGPNLETIAAAPAELTPEIGPAAYAPSAGSLAGEIPTQTESRRRTFLHNLYLLLFLALAAFTLTAWILVRVDSPFGPFSSGPREIVRAQLLALDRGELRPAYDMFSSRYREQVSFDVWHELIVTHWRMFHAEVLRTEEPANSGPGVSLEIYLRGADDRDYRARFLVIRTDGRWWIDDVHWTEERGQRKFSRT